MLVCLLFASKLITAQVYSPKFSGDSLYYKLDTIFTKIYSMPMHDVTYPKLYTLNNHWWSAEISDHNVFIHEKYIVKTYEYRNELEKYYKSAKKENLAYLYKLQAKYGKKYGKDMYYETPSLGMTQVMVYACIGRPSEKNTTKTVGKTSEQWVYKGYSKNSYYYFTNGKLTAIQD